MAQTARLPFAQTKTTAVSAMEAAGTVVSAMELAQAGTVVSVMEPDLHRLRLPADQEHAEDRIIRYGEAD